MHISVKDKSTYNVWSPRKLITHPSPPPPPHTHTHTHRYLARQMAMAPRPIRQPTRQEAEVLYGKLLSTFEFDDLKGLKRIGEFLRAAGMSLGECVCVCVCVCVYGWVGGWVGGSVCVYGWVGGWVVVCVCVYLINTYCLKN